MDLLFTAKVRARCMSKIEDISGDKFTTMQVWAEPPSES